VRRWLLALAVTASLVLSVGWASAQEPTETAPPLPPPSPSPSPSCDPYQGLVPLPSEAGCEVRVTVSIDTGWWHVAAAVVGAILVLLAASLVASLGRS